MQTQLETWQGEFGRAYTDRNRTDWRTLLPAFRHMLKDIPLNRVLEIGCNRGHNLEALREVLGREAKLVGVEPNPHALDLARQTAAADFLPGDIYNLPFESGSFDLVFTAGVLIHIPLGDLAAALAELHRCSRRYLLAIEYAAEEETTIPYREHGDLLWKRDFLKHYQTQFPGLALVRQGFWDMADGFDRCTWWLLEKPSERGLGA
jgi:pseudaminic acid biosynthesis-associated methylase